MRPVQSLACFVLLLAAAISLACAGPAAAVPLPVHLGQAASSFNIEGATAAGGCNCTAAQFHDVGPTSNSYVIPFDGVIVASGIYIGNSVEPVDAPTAQVQTVHVTGASAGTVVSEGLTHSLLGLTKNTVDSFYERLPAAAGDVLAARFHNSGFIQATPYFFKSASSSDSTAVSAPRAAGGSLETGGPPVPERRLNLEAELEPDEDGDGYGDVSQDLCPGSPIAVSACSGTLLGSNLQGARTQVPFCGGGGCMRVQTSIGGVSTAAPTAGVVVRWRVMNAEAGDFRLRVLEFRPESSGVGSNAFKVLHASSLEHVAYPGGGLFSRMSSFPTRLPIPAGAYVGLSGPSVVGLQQGGGATTSYTVTNDVTTPTGGEGLTLSGNTHEGTLLYDADIEPDQDGDGYGDISQDSCPASASVHEGPCPAAPGSDGSGSSGAGTGGPGAQATASSAAGPAAVRISSLAVRPKSFRAKPVGRVAARGATGAKLKLSLSAKATVKLVVTNKKGKRLWTAVRSLGPGPASIPFSGQYQHRGKVLDLAPGAYRLGASVAGAAGTAVSAPFTVLPPA